MRPEFKKFSLLPGIYRISVVDMVYGDFFRGTNYHEKIIDRILVKANSEEDAIRIASDHYKGKGTIDPLSVDTFFGKALKTYDVYTKDGINTFSDTDVIDNTDLEWKEYKKQEAIRLASKEEEENKRADELKILKKKAEQVAMARKMFGFTTDIKKLNPEQIKAIDAAIIDKQNNQHESIDILEKIGNILK